MGCGSSVQNAQVADSPVPAAAAVAVKPAPVVAEEKPAEEKPAEEKPAVAEPVAGLAEEDVQVRLCNEAGMDDLCGGSKGFMIEKTEERGIKVAQLKALLGHVRRRAGKEGWTSTNPSNPKPVAELDINLYDLTFWVIRPSTKARQISYVELVADGDQPPMWFVSHWWGEAVFCFVQVLEEHMRLRGLSVSIAYWVCAYANNQHQLGAEIALDPQATSFFKAMCLSVGVLVILDENSTPFTRIWCAFEEACATRSEVTKKEMLLDIGTATPWTWQGVEHEACILTAGLTPLESAKDAACTGVGHRLKVFRESMFPVAYIEKGLGIDVEVAEASQPADKRRILNSIAKRDLAEIDSDPLANHAEYRRVNQELRGLFAVAGWRSAVKHCPEVLQKFSGALKADQYRKQLNFSFAFSPDFTTERLEEVAAGLPPGLEVLRLECGFCSNLHEIGALGENLPATLREFDVGLRKNALDDRRLGGLVSKLPASLRRLKLDMSDTRVSDVGIRALARDLPESLAHLALGMQSLHGVSDQSLEALAEHMPATLESVKLNLMNVIEVTGRGIGAFAKGLPASLRALELLLLRGMIGDRVCYIGDAALTALAGIPAELEDFKLDMTNDTLITDVGMEALGSALPATLRSLHLELSGCTNISATGMLSFFSSLLPGLKGLCALRLNLEGCPGLTDDSLATLAGLLPGGLHALLLDVTKCAGVSEASFPGLARSLPPGLAELELLASGCACFGDEELLSVAAALPGTLTLVHVSAAGCPRLGDEGFKGLVGKLPGTLEELKLNFSEDTRLTAEAPRALAKSCPRSLHTLSLNLSGCSGVDPEGLDELLGALPVRNTSLLLPASEDGERPVAFTSSQRDFVTLSGDKREACYDPELCGQAPYITVLTEPPIKSGVHALTFEMGKISLRGTYFNVGALPSPLPKDLGTNTGKAVGEEVGGWCGCSVGCFFDNNKIANGALPDFHETGEIIILTLDVPALTGTVEHAISGRKVSFNFREEDLPLHPAICLGIGASMKLVRAERG